jgi:hypothetical protein
MAWLAAFLDGLGVDDFRPVSETRPSGHRMRDRDFPRSPTPNWQPTLSIRWAHLPYRVPASLHNGLVRCRTIQPAFHRLRL